MPEQPLARLQALLRELFQYDYADLDFGIYRLLRLKRGEVEAFLTEQLPRRVDEVFKGAAGEVHAHLERELAELVARVQQEIDGEALTPTGEIKAEYREQKAKAARELIAAYEAKRKQVQEIQVSEEQQAEVFNHLWAFFSRYYEAGDFIPKRRYGARETYAVPYNGEEVFFHWANRDQHYVKTAEALRDYTFTVDMLGKPCRVRFTLTEASLPPGNTKGDARYFFPLPKAVTWDKDTRTFTLPFHYRLPTETEIEKHGKNSKLQESVLQAALPKIIEAVPDTGLKARLAEVVEKKEKEEISLLLKRLRHFCRKNSSDYFIHKDLEGFLRRELEFYLKDQVLHLADLDGDLPAKQRTLRVVRDLAVEVIQFLAQIENVQKRMFEKRKFVLKTDYLVPIQNVPRELWKEIIANDKQLAAWKELLAVEPKKVNEKFLAQHPTLVVNTAHFDAAFKERLLVAFDDLDEATDGLIVKADAYHALRLLERGRTASVRCLYADPPYNTGNDGFVYKDRYSHSSWVAMLSERLERARSLLSEGGVLFLSIDDIEFANLLKFMESTWGKQNQLGVLARRTKSGGGSAADFFAIEHDYVLAWAKLKEAVDPLFIPYDPEYLTRYREQDAESKYFWDTMERSSTQTTPYKIKAPDGTWLEGRWFIGEDRFKKDLEKGDVRVVKVEDGSWSVQFKQRLGLGRKLRSLMHENEYKSSQLELDELGLGGRFSYPKGLFLIYRLLQAATFSEPRSHSVMDIVAGSGTTGHAAINLNREDGGQRKFVLIEMADYFDTVLLPRLQKIMFTPEWKDGKPMRMATKEEAERTPRSVKVLRLEGYEDALHNLVSDETLEREIPRAKAFKEKVGGDAYRLTYMARLPLEASASMLNLAKLEHPFAYTIEVLSEDGPRTETVDLVETFNFLYGLHVQRIETWRDDAGKREYRAVKAKNANGRHVLVLWRDMEKLDPAVERKFLETRLKKDGPFDEAWINGDTAIPGVQSLDGLFKRLLEEEER